MISINTLPQSPEVLDICARCTKPPHPDHTITTTFEQDEGGSFTFTYMLCEDCVPIELEKDAGFKVIKEDYSKKIQLAAVGLGIALVAIVYLLSVSLLIAVICGIAFTTIIANGLKSYFLLRLPDEGNKIVNVQIRAASMSALGLRNAKAEANQLTTGESIFYTFLNEDYGNQFVAKNIKLIAPIKMVISTSLNPKAYAFGMTWPYAAMQFPPAITKDALNLVRTRTIDLNYTEIARENVRKFRDSMELYSTTASKKCTNCGQTVPITTEVGENCPHCGVKFSREQIN